MADVARRADVSTATVSRALRGRPGVSDETRTRIRRIADELAYVISPEASRLSGGVTDRVALVVPRLDRWFYAAMCASVAAELAEAGLDVLLYQVDDEQQRTHFFDELPARRKVDAVVLTALPLLGPEVDRLEHLDVHVVVAGGRVPDYPSVGVDDRALAAAAVDHLAGLRHTRIALLRIADDTDAVWSADAERVAGYDQALAAHGLSRAPDYVVAVPPGPSAGVEAARRLLTLRPRPTGVFVCSDELALGALHHLACAGVAVPDQMSVLAVDNHPLAAVLDLTTFDQHVEQQGRLAAGTVIGLLSGRRPESAGHVVDVQLVDRGSTGPAPGC